jgi:hypothetical protein
MRTPADVEKIQNREDLTQWINELRENLKNHPETWENTDLGRFLGALSSWIDDMDGYYKNHGLPVPQTPSWKTIAEMLAAAALYE